MKFTTVESFSCEGAWLTGHSSYFEAASEFLEIANNAADEYKGQWKTLLEEHGDDGYVNYLLIPLDNKIRRYAIASEIYCCVSIEAFVNFYGIRRLGEEFYKSNYERLTITAKISALIATCEGKLIPKHHPLLKSAKKLFDIRNQLVHPKATEITDPNKVNILSRQDLLKQARDIFQETIEFFKRLSVVDPEVSWQWQLNAKKHFETSVTNSQNSASDGTVSERE